MNRRFTLAIALALLLAPIARRAGAAAPPAADVDLRPKWAKRIGVTEEQMKKLQTLQTAESSEIEPLMEKQRTLTMKLQQQVNAKAEDAALKETLTAIHTNWAAQEEVHRKYVYKRSDVLTPTQQAKMILSRRIPGPPFQNRRRGKRPPGPGNNQEKAPY